MVSDVLGSRDAAHELQKREYEGYEYRIEGVRHDFSPLFFFIKEKSDDRNPRKKRSAPVAAAATEDV